MPYLAGITPLLITLTRHPLSGPGRAAAIEAGATAAGTNAAVHTVQHVLEVDAQGFIHQLRAIPAAP